MLQYQANMSMYVNGSICPPTLQYSSSMMVCISGLLMESRRASSGDHVNKPQASHGLLLCPFNWVHVSAKMDPVLPIRLSTVYSFPFVSQSVHRPPNHPVEVISPATPSAQLQAPKLKSTSTGY